jgi:hypothetical protein
MQRRANMNEVMVGIAMLVSSTGVSPALETSRATVSPPAFTITSPVRVPAAPTPTRRLFDQQPTGWRTSSSRTPTQSRQNRFSPTDRVIALAAGVAVGWVAGGAVGYKLTDNPSHPYDDTSGLRGMIIGAPIGATVGAILGWKLTGR